MKRLILPLLCLLLFISLTTPVAASLPHVVDHADLLSAQEEAYLEAKASQLVENYQMDVVILTVDSLEHQSSEAYADDYYDQNGYGIGYDGSGVLLLLSMEYRDWAISTCGDAIYALTDYGIQSIFFDIASYLSQDLYFEAFDVYLDTLETYYSAYNMGAPIDGYRPEYDGPGTYIPGTQEDIYYYDDAPVRSFGWYLKKFFIALVIGVVIAAIVLIIMRAQMNTARAQRGASSYVQGGRAKITQHRDIFLYSQIHKTRKQQSSGGGGSSVHGSSGGRNHGGGHGKF